MVPRLHKKGRSFRGAALYLLHDKERATTADRVAWTHTRNLATQNADLAWRVMAATAMDQNRLKEEAGVKRTGRKSNAHVLHYSLSWHADEAAGLTKEEMLRAAEQSLAVLGKQSGDHRQFADEHQALIICHSDEKHPHVHVLVNRVHPGNGVMLSSSNEKLRLSEWAQQYERERGAILCRGREFNNAARGRGQFVRGEDRSRNQYENDKRSRGRRDADRIRREQKAIDRKLAANARQTKKKQRSAWESLREAHRSEKEAIREATRRRIGRAAAKVREDFRPTWAKLGRYQRDERSDFERKEGNVLGAIRNALRSTDLRAVMHSETRGTALKQLFTNLASRGAREQAFEEKQAAVVAKIRAQQERAIKQAVEAERVRERQELASHRKRFAERRERLIEQHGRDWESIRQAWRDRRVERVRAWKENVAVRDFEAAADRPTPQCEQAEGRRTSTERYERARPGLRARPDDFRTRRDRDRGRER